MRKILTFLLALCLVAGLCACGGPSDDEIKAVRNVAFEGTELTVTLGTNKSTGYEWNYEIYGDCIEPSVNRSFKVTGSKGDAAGEVSIGFEGRSAGTAVIVFATPRGWDGTGAGDGYTVNVEVNGNGQIVNAAGSEGANPPELTPEQTAEPVAEVTVEPVAEVTAEPEPSPKTSISIAELVEGEYKGTMPKDEYANSSDTIFMTLSPADLIVTIENGQITLYCNAVSNAYGMLNGTRTPDAPQCAIILSGSLPLQQSGDAITAQGEVPMLGESLTLNYADGVFTDWEVKQRKEGSVFTCSVRITMENGVPTATVTAGNSRSSRTGVVPLVPRDKDTGEPLSAPYAELLKSGDYQYTYSLEYEGQAYTATIASCDGMICRKVVSADGTFSQRVITVDGNAWRVDDLTGEVVDGGTANAETQPDYSSALTFAASRTLETGAIADAYDFNYDGYACQLVFLFSPDGTLVMLVMSYGDNTSEMEILSFGPIDSNSELFDIPR